MIAMVLAAGLGTRLRPLTERIPKPALPLLGSTLLGTNLALLQRAGVREVVVNAHHLPETIARVAREASERLGLHLHLSFEAPEVLGTGGALVAARPLLDRGEPFLLINGDVLCDFDLAQLYAEHRASGADASMVVLPWPGGSDYAPVEVDGAGFVRRIAGQGEAGDEELEPRLFTGIHFLSPFVFDWLPEGFSCINRQGHLRWIAEGKKVRALLARGRWSDVGTPERYVEANLDLLHGRYRLPEAREGSAIIEPNATVGEGATLTPPYYVGRGAVVRSGASVGPDAVLLEEAVVEGEVRNAVVAPGGHLPARRRCVGGLWDESTD